ncbi:MAG: hypothetical protein FJ291_22300 [Planctomycetes bacterium]|nr:hypothetical protein [Planctomycetota bacterium]
MTARAKSRLPDALRRLIDSYRRRWRVVYTHTGLLITVAVLATGVGAAIAADRLFRLAPVPRAVALGAILLSCAVCLARWVVWPAVRRMRDADTAARLGHHFPKVEEDLVTAVELSSETFDERGISHGLVESALRQITQRSSTVDYKAAVPARPLLKAGAVAVVLLAVLFAAYQVSPEAIRNALARLFRPAAGVPYFSYTNLKIEPGDRVVRVGDAVDITITTTGRPASSASLEGRKGDGAEAADRLSLALTLSPLPLGEGKGEGVGVGAGAARGALTPPSPRGRGGREGSAAQWNTGPLFKDLRYRVSAGDALSPWHHIRVVAPPSLSKKSAVLILPKYAGSVRRTVETVEGSLQVVEGTEVVIRCMPVARGPEPELQCAGELRVGGESFPLAPEGAGVLASKPFLPRKNAECVITLRDGYGLTNRSPETLAIKVVADRPPAVSVARPGRDLLVLPGEKVPLEAAARDEFGVRSLVLAHRAIKAKEAADASERWQRRTLKEGSPTASELVAAEEMVIDQLGLVPGDILEYKAEAADYADDAVLRRGVSPLYRIVVLSEIEHLERILTRLKELQLEMMRRAATQRAQSGQADKLASAKEAADREGKEPTAKGKEADTGGKEPDKGGKEADKTAREGARQAHERQAEETRGTDHLARKLERLIPEMARNPATPTDMMAQMEQLGRGVRQTANTQMQNAADQFAKAAQGQQSQQGEPSPLRIAQGQTDEAARRLEQLAQLAERLQRRGLLEKLAAEAEALAARQREIKDNLVPLAKESLGTDPKNMGDEQKAKLQRITAAQRAIKEGVDNLGKEIEKAAGALAFSNPSDGATAEEAKAKLDDDKVSERAGTIARRLGENALFSQVPEQEKVATSLLAVAAILRRRSEELEAFMKELEEFIRRQKAINTGIEGAIKKVEKARRPAELGSDQAVLQRDVSEQASALHWLANEIAMFRSQAAAKLDAAAKEMGEGATDLYAVALPEGLEHGKRALALLEDAREKLTQEMQQMQQAAMSAQMMRALLLLQRCLVGQKRVNTGTIQADAIRAREPDAFESQTAALTKRQSNVHLDATKLEKLLGQFPAAAELVNKSGEKMNVSRIALAGSDTGKETREVQRMALALLEQLLKECQGGMCGAMGAMMGARAQAMMQMMGGSGGGFDGGSNAPVMPANPAEAKGEDWRRVRSRFDEQLGAAFEGTLPAQYRDLLNSYFDRLRKEPIR